MQDYQKLAVWQKARNLVKEIYTLTKSYPKSELYGLTNQMRRSSISIPANLAEGCSRFSQADLCRFSQIALGSANELECLLILSKDLNFINETEFKQLNTKIIEIRKMLSSFIKKLKQEQ